MRLADIGIYTEKNCKVLQKKLNAFEKVGVVRVTLWLGI